MADTTVVDDHQLGKIAHELQAIKQELSAQLDRFSTGSDVSGTTYGTLPASGSAAAQHQGSVAEMINRLQALSDTFAEQADGLLEAARLFCQTDDDGARQLRRIAPRPPEGAGDAEHHDGQ